MNEIPTRPTPCGAERIADARREIEATNSLRERSDAESRDDFTASDLELMARTERVAEEIGQSFGAVLENRLWEIHGRGVKSAKVAPIVEDRIAAVRRLRDEMGDRR